MDTSSHNSIHNCLSCNNRRHMDNSSHNSIHNCLFYNTSFAWQHDHPRASLHHHQANGRGGMRGLPVPALGALLQPVLPRELPQQRPLRVGHRGPEQPPRDRGLQRRAVFDGPALGSRLLGRVCHGSRDSFTSSSNFMSIRFVSDGSVTRSGFQADYYSRPSNHSTKLLCLPDRMQANVSRSYLQTLGYSASDLVIPRWEGVRPCQAQVTASQVTFTIPYAGCGTVQQLDNDTITYSNTLQAASAVASGVIQRRPSLHLHVSCRMLRDTWVDLMYVANDNAEVQEVQYGHFAVNMSFYTSPSFAYPVTSHPYYVRLNQDLYVQAEIRRADASMALFVDTCVASPSSEDLASVTYDLIRSGCVRDDTYQALPAPPGLARFRFRSFHFLRRLPAVYLHCKVLVCRAHDPASRCRSGCQPRPKRDVGAYQEQVDVVLGPIRLQAP
ncbi:deleted in malignant brain tumors 1 protein [Eptesicus fuscus]|uniref:deleted in malignant brain tumors 1 protein n=1 Tax=Eptesicus fuscus TaxID=29078 RepID=UPI002403A97C|nr:deleted in malignant brain tumors 1 protein [Eptesicus fuscus]XP_054585069.1 deleted in malignant brain tumors 1 protein [Eptesicus fuscus]XP_054585070.1 deleted in malignant brain tumors 1 protein [Eptesicus fuscus]